MQVQKRQPHVVRIVLSGHSSQESSLKSIGVAHQFLAKPCDPDRLKQTVDVALGLRALMADEGLQNVLSNITSVPSAPQIYKELVEEVQHEDTDAQRVGLIVAKDPGMTTNILHLVNSAFFGLPRQVSSAVQAAKLLGVDTIRTLVLTLDVFSQFDDCAAGGISPSTIRDHSNLVAYEAKRIGMLEKASREIMDAILMAGLLHDVGKLILAQNIPDEYRLIVEMEQQKSLTCVEAETKVLGTTHADVGGYLLGLWGLPDSIVEAVALHHNPSKSPHNTFSTLTAVHVANILVDAGNDSELARSALDMEYINRLNMTDRLEAWLAGSDQLTEAVASTYDE